MMIVSVIVPPASMAITLGVRVAAVLISLPEVLLPTLLDWSRSDVLYRIEYSVCDAI